MPQAKQTTTIEATVHGTLEVAVPLELPRNKAALRKLAISLGIDDSSSLEEVAKQIVIEAIRVGLDNMEHRQSSESSVEEYDLEVEIDS